MDTERSGEHISTGGGGGTGTITLKHAVKLGEYQPEVLSRYKEWHLLSRHAQLQLIREGITHRKSQLMTQYAQIFNTLDYSLKRDILEPRLNHILDLVKDLDRDEERYLSTYV